VLRLDVDPDTILHLDAEDVERGIVDRGKPDTVPPAQVEYRFADSLPLRGH